MSGKGVVLEYDFTVLNGAEILFDTARAFLRELDGIELDFPTECRYLAGNDYQSGFETLFAAVKTKKTAAKAAKDLNDAFRLALDRAVSRSANAAFRNFVRALTERGVKVVIATRADICADAVRNAFDGLLGETVVLYQEPSVCYGTVKWDSWRLACVKNRLRPISTLAIAGSGLGVKSALLAGMRSLGVVNPRVAYQDFGGANELVEMLDTAAAKKVLSLLRL